MATDGTARVVTVLQQKIDKRLSCDIYFNRHDIACTGVQIQSLIPTGIGIRIVLDKRQQKKHHLVRESVK